MVTLGNTLQLFNTVGLFLQNLQNEDFKSKNSSLCLNLCLEVIAANSRVF